MKEDFSLLRFTIEAEFIKRLNACKWWQFKKKKQANEWREEKEKLLKKDEDPVRVPTDRPNVSLLF